MSMTNFKPASPLIELLPPSLEELFLSTEITELSDNTDFLWEFVHLVSVLPPAPESMLYEREKCDGVDSTMFVTQYQCGEKRAKLGRKPHLCTI
jgi:hypothetical protein